MTSVLVLGLGAMGSATCDHLARRGFNVTGIEQFSPGHDRGSSHGQSRMIRKAYFEHSDYVPLLGRAYELWYDLERRAQKQFYHPTGIIYSLPRSSTLLAGLRESSSRYGIPVETLGKDTLSKLPFHFPEDQIVLKEPEAGYLDVEACVVENVKQAKLHGAKICEGERVVTWTATPRSVEVVTDKRTYTADRLVITAGAWSGEILRELGIPLRILRKRMFWLEAGAQYSQTPCFFFERPYGIFYGFPGTETGLKLAEHSGGIEIPTPEPHPAVLDSEISPVRRFIEECIPDLGPIKKSAGCYYTMTPDQHFVIDVHPRHANVSYAAGFSGHGFKFSSVVGEVLADLAAVGETKQAIEFLRAKRLI